MKQVKITTTATVINTDAQQTQRMTSLEIAELTGKQHKNVMQAIRNMEPAWDQRQYAEVNRQQHDRVIRACFIVVDASRLYKIVNLFT